MKPDVSIIVPCYNVAAYIDTCLESLTRQTLYHIEIICINDGSTDNTWERLLRWQAKDARIILLNQSNAGVSAARNAGLDAAQGLYIGFTDPDDYVDRAMYDRLLSGALEHDADVVECGNHVFSDSTTQLIDGKKRSPRWHFEANASPANFFRDSVWGKMDICVWSKLFRRRMVETHRLRFNTALKHGAEDETFRLTALPHASRLLFIPDCLYYYRLMRRGSLSRHSDKITHTKCVQEFRRLLYIVGYWKERNWMNAGLFAYGVRKLKPFFVSKTPPFNRMTNTQKQSMLAWWNEFYRHADGEQFRDTLSERDKQLVDLLNSVHSPANGVDRILLLAGSCLPGQRGRYYSCKKVLSEHLSHTKTFDGNREKAALQAPFDIQLPPL